MVGQADTLKQPDELEQLAAEAAAKSRPASSDMAAQDSGIAKPADEPKVDEGLVIVMSQFVAVAGMVACKRFGVAPLETEEVQALGQAAGKVAAFYMPTDINPKAAAWISLGMVTTAVVAKRVDLSPPEPRADTAKEDDAKLQPAPEA